MRDFLKLAPMMGHPGSVSRSVSDGRADEKFIQTMKKIENVLSRVLIPPTSNTNGAADPPVSDPAVHSEKTH
jgi:hypothetical protein